jgi:hypothetical protein
LSSWPDEEGARGCHHAPACLSLLAPYAICWAFQRPGGPWPRRSPTVLVMALEEYLGVRPAAKPAPKPTTKAKGRRG